MNVISDNVTRRPRCPWLFAGVLALSLPWLGVVPLATGQTTFEVRVGHDDDDAEEDDGGSIALSNSLLELGAQQWVGVRFLNVTVPKESCISTAYVEWTAKDSNTETTDLTIFGEDEDDAARFTSTSDDISDRTRTMASVTWNNVPNWTAGTTYQTLDITNIVQEIVDRGSWASGNAMAILFRSDDLNGKRLSEAHDGTPGAAAL